MDALSASTASPAPVAAEPLSPARAALLRAIECLDTARERLDHAQKALNATEDLRLPVSGQEADDLRTQMGRLGQIAAWLKTSAEGAAADAVRPSLAAELKDAEGWLSEVAGAATMAEEQLSVAERDYTEAAHAARDALIERDRAVWAAAADATGPALRKLQRAVAAVYERDARLRSLIVALREVGNRNTETNSGAFAAASAIESALGLVRRQTARSVDSEIGRALIERLQTDPFASL
jgi:hypothetical protein